MQKTSGNMNENENENEREIKKKFVSATHFNDTL